MVPVVVSGLQALGEDPFRRSPVVALLPCVRLDIPHNLKLFQATLCEVRHLLMRYLISTSSPPLLLSARRDFSLFVGLIP